MSEPVSMPSPQPAKRWSLARRFLLISLTVVLTQSLASLLITRELRQIFLRGFLEKKLDRQAIAPLKDVNDQLDQLTAEQAKRCCTIQDYQRFLKPLRLYDGKVGMIVGNGGLASTRGSHVLFSQTHLHALADRAVAAPQGFAMVENDEHEAVALKAIKLPGGAATGHFVYLRPLYSMPLIHAQMMIKLASELTLILLTTAILIIAARRIFKPIRSISRELSEIELNTLQAATLSTAGAPVELLPILQEFNQMVERLQLSASNQKQFASTISHEFRTPLTVISGFIQSVLNRGESLAEQQRNALGIANQEVLRLNRMLSDLLDLSRADNHQLSIRREPFDLMPSLEHGLRLARAAHTNPIRDNLKGLPALEVIGDPDRLVQCISNLIGNAVKYSAPDSPISLEVRPNPKTVRLIVEDQGQGIPADQLERIFERFTRAEGVSIPKGQSSSGLGLSIVQMLMEAMGGTVTVRSTVGEGSQFSLELPLITQA